jgi:hypothetical protein
VDSGGGFWRFLAAAFSGGGGGWRWFRRLFVGFGVRMKEKRDGVGFVKKSGVFILFHVVFFGDVSKLYWRL